MRCLRCYSLWFVVGLTAALTVGGSLPARGCLWDIDTLQMERSRFPEALELIAGKFLRHSAAFYEWRVGDRKARLAAQAAGTKTLSEEQRATAYDDLAVSLDKLGQHEAAIATIREKAAALPKTGRYETHANLGTFLIHAGRFQDGLPELKQAIAINPDAHFGRERYQILLVEYLLEQRGDAATLNLPLAGEARSGAIGYGEGVPPFTHWLLVRQGLMKPTGQVPDPAAAEAEIARATKGVLGMMRFGDYTSPVLLEALGDLLLTGSNVGSREMGQRLAARAYLRAAQGTNSPTAQQAYQSLAERTLATQRADGRSGEQADGSRLELATLENQLDREVQEANDWFATVADDEQFWIARSPEPEARYWEKYGTADIRIGYDRLPSAKFSAKGLSWLLRFALAGSLVAVVVTVVGLTLWRRQQPNGYDTPECEALGQDAGDSLDSHT